MRRVAVTGLGAITPVGSTARETWDSAVSGRSGIDFIRSFDASDYPVRIAAEVKDFDPTSVVPVKEARRLDRYVLLALAAAQEAVADASRQLFLDYRARTRTLSNHDHPSPCIPSDFWWLSHDSRHFPAWDLKDLSEAAEPRCQPGLAGHSARRVPCVARPVRVR